MADTSGRLYDIQIEVESVGLSGFVDSDNFIVLQGIDQSVVGLDFQSPDGLLVPLEDGEVEPFQFALVNQRDHISLGVLGDAVTVDGTLRTNIQYFGDIDNLAATWGGLTGPEMVLPLTHGNDLCATPSLSTLSDCADNLDERDAILEELGFLLGDIDGREGGVRFADFLILADNFGRSDRTYVDGDLDLDGTVTFADFLVLADNFGESF